MSLVIGIQISIHKAMNTQHDKLGAVAALEQLRQRAKLCKDRHFAAAERKGLLQNWCGLPVILINVFVGTVLIKFLQSEAPPSWAAAAATALAFLAASLSAVQTFFSFSKMAEGHRSIANRYLDISRQCENLLLRLQDQQISSAKLWDRIEELSNDYDSINVEAEAFPTSRHDFEVAKKKISIVPFSLPPAPATTVDPPAASQRPRGIQP